MWFSVGNKNAPVVYAYLDPTCPFCARAVKAMRSDIDSGKIQMRVIMAPLIAANSPDVIAGILSSGNPVENFMTHEAAVSDRTTSPVALVDFAKLPAEMADGIRKNYQKVIDYEIPGVPFFVFDTAEGEKYFSGVPDASSFDGALHDTFTGSN